MFGGDGQHSQNESLGFLMFFVSLIEILFTVNAMINTVTFPSKDS